MFELLTAGQNIPFTVALAVMLVIAVVEGVGALFGVGLSGLFDSVAPEVEVPVEFSPEGEVIILKRGLYEIQMLTAVRL